MRAAIVLVSCSIGPGLGGCSAVEQMVFGSEPALDHSMIYLAAYEQVETTREEVEHYACLNGAPLVCDILGLSLVECWCP